MRFFIKTIIFLLFLVPSFAFAVTQINSLPYTASTANETYELSSDLSTTGHGINVTANGVTIDLKGHKLTWGTANVAANHGIYSTTNKSVTVLSSVAGGELYHGATTNPPGCHGIYLSETPVNPIVHDIAITVKSRATDGADPDCINCQTAGILFKRTKNAQVYNTTIDNQASEVKNRHSVPATGVKIEGDTVTASTDIQVYNNTIRSTMSGVTISGATAGTTAVKVLENTITIAQVAVNSYAIGIGGPGGSTNAMAGGAEVARNTISVSGAGGRGIIASHIDYFDIHHNTMTVGEAPTAESVWSNGIRLRYGARFGKVRENIVNVLCGKDGYSGGTGMRFTAQSGVDASNPLDIDNEIINNTVNTTNNSDDYSCAAIWFGNMEAGHNWTINKNTITTNDKAIVLEPDASPSYSINDLVVDNTSITKSSTTPGVTYYSYALLDTQGGASDVSATFNCTTYAGGALETDKIQSATGTFNIAYNPCALGYKFLGLIRDSNGHLLRVAQ